MSQTTLIAGAGRNDRVIDNAEDYLKEYEKVTGCVYLDHVPLTPADFLLS